MATGTAKQIWITMGLSILSIMFITALVLTTDIHLKIVGLDISIENQTGRGVVVRMNGPECPKQACSAFALDHNRVNL